jgi:hypothetical protein
METKGMAGTPFTRDQYSPVSTFAHLQHLPPPSPAARSDQSSERASTRKKVSPIGEVHEKKAQRAPRVLIWIKEAVTALRATV